MRALGEDIERPRRLSHNLLMKLGQLKPAGFCES